MKSERHRNGAYAESIVETKLIELGIPVSKPSTEESYDMIADIDGSLIRVQVKMGFKTSERIAAEFRGTSATSQGIHKRYYSEDEIDAFCIVNPDNKDVYFLWFDETPNSHTDRYETTWEEDLIDVKLPEMTFEQKRNIKQEKRTVNSLLDMDNGAKYQE